MKILFRYTCLITFLIGVSINLHGYDYRDNFEEESCGKMPSHWMPKYPSEKDQWIVVCENGNCVYRQGTLSDEGQYSYLHVFERNPTFEGRFRVGQTRDGYLAFLVRYNDEGSYVKVKYN